MKKCTGCLQEKALVEFSVDRQARDGLCFRCKLCAAAYRAQNKEAVVLRAKEYYQKHKEEISVKYREHRAQKKEYNAVYHQEKKEKCNERSRTYYRTHCEELKAYAVVYRGEHKEDLKQYRKNIRARAQSVANARRKTDVCFRLRMNVSRSIAQALRKRASRKCGSCLQRLPFSVQELKAYLEKQFEPWMTWENYGVFEENCLKWHIDHIIPHAAFHYTTMDCEEFRKCWSLANLRPLEAKENLKKGAKL